MNRWTFVLAGAAILFSPSIQAASLFAAQAPQEEKPARNFGPSSSPADLPRDEEPTDADQGAVGRAQADQGHTVRRGEADYAGPVYYGYGHYHGRYPYHVHRPTPGYRYRYSPYYGYYGHYYGGPYVYYGAPYIYYGGPYVYFHSGPRYGYYRGYRGPGRYRCW